MSFRTGCIDFNINHKIECIGCVVCFKLIRLRAECQSVSSAKRKKKHTVSAFLQAFDHSINPNPICLRYKILRMIFPERAAFKIHAQ